MARSNTRNRLIKYSTDLFYERGYADTSIRQIAQETGLNSANIYYYFKDKEGLLFEVIKSGAVDILEALLEVEKRHTDPLDCLKAMLRTHLRLHIITYRKETKIWAIDFYWLKPEHRDEIKNINRRIYHLFREKIVKLVGAGILNDINSAVIFNSLEGIISWNIQWTRETGKLSREEIVDEIEKLFMKGLAT